VINGSRLRFIQDFAATWFLSDIATVEYQSAGIHKIKGLFRRIESGRDRSRRIHRLGHLREANSQWPSRISAGDLPVLVERIRNDG